MESVIGKYIFNSVLNKVTTTIGASLNFKWYNTTNGLYVACERLQITTSYMSYYYGEQWHDVYNFNTNEWLNNDCKEIDFGNARQFVTETIGNFINNNSTEPRMVLYSSNKPIRTANEKKIDTLLVDDILYKIDCDDIKSNKTYTGVRTITRVADVNYDFVYNMTFNATGGMSGTCNKLTISQTSSGVKITYTTSVSTVVAYEDGWKVANGIQVITGIKDLNNDVALGVFNKVFVYFE